MGVGGYCIVCSVPLFLEGTEKFYCSYHIPEDLEECAECHREFGLSDLHLCSYCHEYEYVCEKCWGFHWLEDDHVTWSASEDSLNDRRC